LYVVVGVGIDIGIGWCACAYVQFVLLTRTLVLGFGIGVGIFVLVVFSGIDLGLVVYYILVTTNLLPHNIDDKTVLLRGYRIMTYRV
jgi:hypothetical protein